MRIKVLSEAIREAENKARRASSNPELSVLYLAQMQRLEVELAEEKMKVAPQSNPMESRVGLLEPKMVEIKPGSFAIGSRDPGGRGVHQVTIKPLAIGRYEVTFEHYDQFALATRRQLPSDEGWGRGRRPVINVSWGNAKSYAEWLSQQTDKRYRLPTEAEWEYAARSGEKNDAWAGTSDPSQLKDYAVYNVDRTQPVGGKNPNSFGLHDMSGNVWEWVEDCWHNNYNGAPTDGSAWLEAGGGDCGQRVIRGGSWLSNPEYLRASSRGWGFADYRLNNIGFRLAQDLP
jgi:formylglycine-generating enzyme required for sulfatase activity